MAISVEQFIERLTESGLLSAADLSQLQDSLPPERQPKDVQQLAQVLVQRGKLTKYQAQAVYQGKTKGLVFGQYVVLDKLGEGGMGVVLKAQHRRMKRTVAIKVLSSGAMKQAGAVQRFHREVEAAAKLSHPNIVTAYDADEHQGMHYLAMEYVEGRDLATIVKDSGPLGVQRAAECILQAARGLQYAHGRGIVHRDIKPGNLLLDKEGTVKILDMGLARIAGADAAMGGPERLTTSGQVMGTCDYMAPEQAMDSHTVDARADIYALGCTLYRLLIGRPPYGGDSLMQILMAHQQAPIPSLCAARAEVPAELDELFQRMVAKKPEDRQQSMAEVIAELEAILGASPGRSVAGAPEEPSSAALVQSLAFLQENTPSGPLTKQKKPIATERTEPSIGPEHATGSNILGKALGAVAKARRKPLVLLGIAGGLLLLLGIVLAITLRHGATESKIQDLKSQIPNPQSPPPPAVAPFDEKKAKEHQAAWAEHLGVPVEITNSIGMKLVLIPPGEFMMGSPKELIEEEWKSHGDDQWYKEHLPGEGPQHRVRITRPFYLGTYVVTQQEYQRVMGTNPNEFSATGKGKDKVAGQDTKRFPVENVSWGEAVEFCRKLSNLPEETATGRTYRLPSEAQWEYACRAGNAGRYSFSLGGKAISKEQDENGLSDYAWFYGNSGGMTHAVGGKRANAWGLYDVHGNVWEWCQDWYDKEYYANSLTDDPAGPSGGSGRVNRGGSWFDTARFCRSAFRHYYGPGSRIFNLGLRACLVLPDKAAERAELSSTTVAAHPSVSSPAKKPSPAPPAPDPQSPTPSLADKHQTAWQDLFDGRTLDGWRVVEDAPEFAKHGTVLPRGRELIFEKGDPATGIAWTREVRRVDYEISLEAMRERGTGSLCEVFFPFKDEYCKLAVAGDNTMVCLELVDDRPGPQNATQRKFACQDGRWYRIRLRVTAAAIEAWVDDEKMVDFDPARHKLSLHPYQFPLRPFGLRTWNSAAAIRNLRLRQLTTGAAEKAGAWKVYTDWPFDSAEARQRQEETAKHLGVPVEMTNSIGMKLALIPPGEFVMGSPKELIQEELQAHADDKWYTDRLPGEGPKHKVRITKPFYCGVYKVTQEEFQRVMGSNPSWFSATGKGKDMVAGQDTKRFPVDSATWNEALEFCRKLSEMPQEKAAGRTYLLPSEAQWEYACRAGGTGRFSFSLGGNAISKEQDEHGLSDYAWFYGNSGGMTHAVGGKRPSAWGLYDMHGNLWHWCQDWCDKEYYAHSPADNPGGPPAGSLRVIRGGGWNDPAGHCRSAARFDGEPGARGHYLGFRASLVLADK
jgi:serine/threonine-protein kinase